MKLALGTAQFGMDYGIANKRGRLSSHEARAIIEFAAKTGVTTLDTAIVYGEGERRLGEIGVTDWNVVSKLPAVPAGCDDIYQWVTNELESSRIRLKHETLYGLLLHRPCELLEENGAELFQALQKVKRAGLVRKIGISIYDPAELELLIHQYRFDLVQAPFNVFDRRILDSGWMSRLSDQGIELHVRSIFLQGLLLMRADERPKKFESWLPLWNKFDDWLKLNDVTSLQACLAFPLSFREISKVIVGVDSLNQMIEIVEASRVSVPPPPATMASADLDLIDPSRWNELT